MNVIITLATAIVAAIGAYLAAVRKLSGTIATSTAEDLWAESREIRRDLAGRIGVLNELVDRQQKRIDELETENAGQAAKILSLQKDVYRLRHGEGK